MTNYSYPIKGQTLLNIPIKLHHPSARIPQRMDEGSVGYDIFLPEALTLYPFNWDSVDIVHLRFSMAVPPSHYATIALRSSVAKKGIIIPNAPPTIDSSYRGEWKLMLKNLTDYYQEFEAGDRIAQIIFHEVNSAAFEVRDKLPETTRGSGGFGSTGK